MDQRYLALLKNQLEKLEMEDFDLDAWKGSTTALLNRIYGENSPQANQVEKLKIDYSSWSLRDSSSTYNPEQSCKQQGKAILEMVIMELENFGLPEENSPPSPVSLLERESNGNLEEVKKVINSDLAPGEKVVALTKHLNSLRKDTLVKVISNILAHQ